MEFQAYYEILRHLFRKSGQYDFNSLFLISDQRRHKFCQLSRQFTKHGMCIPV